VHTVALRKSSTALARPRSGDSSDTWFTSGSPSSSVAHNLVCNVPRSSAKCCAGILQDIVLEGEPLVDCYLPTPMRRCSTPTSGAIVHTVALRKSSTALARGLRPSVKCSSQSGLQCPSEQRQVLCRHTSGHCALTIEHPQYGINIDNLVNFMSRVSWSGPSVWCIR
jgi:hypothetical protein